jgi:hypothetical protein
MSEESDLLVSSNPPPLLRRRSTRSFNFEEHPKDFNYYAGGFLAFLLAFSMWCLWDAFVSSACGSEDAGHVKSKSPECSFKVNGIMILGCASIMAFLRYVLGPVLNSFFRAVFSFTLLIFVMASWNAIEGFIGYSTDNYVRVWVYVGLLCGTIFTIIIYDFVAGYDVIGKHLLF